VRTVHPCILLLLGAVFACGGDAGPGPSPALVSLSAGDNQIGPAGQELGTPLEVTVRDGSGRPLSGIVVTWTTSGGGSVTPPSMATGADGRARVRRTLGDLAGAQTTTATVAALPPVVFHQTAQVQGATEIRAVSPPAHADSVGSAVSLTARVRDQNGAPVPGVVVTWSAAAGAVLSRHVDTSDASGLTSVTLALSTAAGDRSVHATVSGLIGSPVAFVEHATAGQPSRASLSSGDLQVGPVRTKLAAPHRVLVLDAYGNPVSGTPVRWSVGDGGGLVDGATTTVVATDNFGIAAVIRTLGSAAGPHSDTAVVAGVAGSPVVFSDTAGALVTVQVGNEFFTPAVDTIPVGTFVRFVWVSGGTLHNVAWDGGDPTPLPPDSPNQSMLFATFLVRLPSAGVYHYHCAFHGTPGVLVAR
jgi:plastocyanin